KRLKKLLICTLVLIFALTGFTSYVSANEIPSTNDETLPQEISTELERLEKEYDISFDVIEDPSTFEVELMNVEDIQELEEKLIEFKAIEEEIEENNDTEATSSDPGGYISPIFEKDLYGTMATRTYSGLDTVKWWNPVTPFGVNLLKWNNVTITYSYELIPVNNYKLKKFYGGVDSIKIKSHISGVNFPVAWTQVSAIKGFYGNCLWGDSINIKINGYYTLGFNFNGQAIGATKNATWTTQFTLN
ncbi:hypothetical protein V7147_08400, partial [Bacillus sp. JJ1521]|uniref:hypothetical protein n=1 Tax=Bacillus sp. JJ1521 TaxID=3122957 RepID=UPI0030000031